MSCSEWRQEKTCRIFPGPDVVFDGSGLGMVFVGGSAFPKPIGFKTTAQSHTGPVQHDPEVGFTNVQHGTDLLRGQSVHFPEKESSGDMGRHLVTAGFQDNPEFLVGKRICRGVP